jgi:hypothetical protein
MYWNACPVQHRIVSLQRRTIGILKLTSQFFTVTVLRKVDAVYPNLTRGPEVFVEKQLAIFRKYKLVDRITYQSFDWRTIKMVRANRKYDQASAMFTLIVFASVQAHSS